MIWCQFHVKTCVKILQIQSRLAAFVEWFTTTQLPGWFQNTEYNTRCDATFTFFLLVLPPLSFLLLFLTLRCSNKLIKHIALLLPVLASDCVALALCCAVLVLVPVLVLVLFSLSTQWVASGVYIKIKCKMQLYKTYLIVSKHKPTLTLTVELRALNCWAAIW